MKKQYLLTAVTALLLFGCTDKNEEAITPVEAIEVEETTLNATEPAESTQDDITVVENDTTNTNDDERFAGYTLIEVDACDLSGNREPNVIVDIGYGSREYWAMTNEHGQLIKVVADEIILQDDRSEPVTASGRYCNDEAKVPGVESKYLDEGHVIADSLGANSNAYNITAQNSTLNRHGDQAYMEDAIRKAGGASNFEAIITYPNTNTQIPSSYQYTYTLRGGNGTVIVDKFDNVNPDEVNASLGLTSVEPTDSNRDNDISGIDTNGDGQVTIKEAKAAGFTMPVKRDEHWLYQYMYDGDNDGLVGE